LPLVRPLLSDRVIKGMAHITGGGITENLPRILPQGLEARIDRSAWTPAPIFGWLQRAGGVPDDDMLRTFNMGIGLIVACAASDERRVLEALRAAGEPSAVRIGEIRAGANRVSYV
jgi:phosphoribosylformylglycinamidine cyclo-ligase